MSSTSSAQSSLRSPPTHQYPQEIQLKIYQAFIFSIPILFSIILVLLFYLFYLKRRSPSSTPPPVLPMTRSNVASAYDCDDSKTELENKLSTISLVECAKTRDSSMCCVCLGEFDQDSKEESLVQVASCCEHIFHSECIHHWLRSNATCPLCRAPIHYVEINSSHDLIISRGGSSRQHIYNYKFHTTPSNIITTDVINHHCVESQASSSSVC